MLGIARPYYGRGGDSPKRQKIKRDHSVFHSGSAKEILEQSGQAFRDLNLESRRARFMEKKGIKKLDDFITACDNTAFFLEFQKFAQIP